MTREAVKKIRPERQRRPAIERLLDSDVLLRRQERALELCECLIDISAALFNVSSKELRRYGRTSNAISKVRHVAMYVARVVLHLTTHEIGMGFGRDRTTVAHACQVVEDLRDDPEFDQLICTLERIAAVALQSRIER